jgi:hypothetical protein
VAVILSVVSSLLTCTSQAEQYLSPASPLAEKLLHRVHRMHHDDLRVVISTQSVQAIPPELLDLTNIAVLHQFHSPQWFAQLAARLPMPKQLFAEIRSLDVGEALVFGSRTDMPATIPQAAAGWYRVRIRQRLTAQNFYL